MTILKFFEGIAFNLQKFKNEHKVKEIILNVFASLFDRVPRKGLIRPCDNVIIQSHCHFPGVLQQLSGTVLTRRQYSPL